MRDDYDFNIKFCELVASNSVIYDHDRPDYLNRHVQEQTWQAIAKKLKENGKFY